MMMDGESNRIWVQQAALDAVRGFQRPSVRRPSSSSLHNSLSSVGGAGEADSLASGSSHGRSLRWGWKRGVLVDSGANGVVVRLVNEANVEASPASNDGGVVTLPSSALQDGLVVVANDYPSDENGAPCPPSDLITLTHLHEPSVVESLEYRYANDAIYTSTGEVLLALNPFTNVRGLYGESVMRRYWEKAERHSKSPLPPHVYAIADDSFRSMMRSLEDASSNANQSILVSGESGAGKTVTTKFVMKYLAALSQRSAVLQQPEKRAYLKVQEASTSPRRTLSPRRAFSQPSWALSSASSANTSPVPNWKAPTKCPDSGLSSVTLLAGASNSIEAQVLQSNPILESFGNARTVRNDNSSRFGKFIEIQFTRGGKLVGANIETYLLEKVRLIAQAAGERNYHVFYELLSGAVDARELAQYFIARTAAPEDFKITASGTYHRRDGVEDAETYRQLRTAMSTMKFSTDEIKEVFSLTAAILHASNLTFCDLPGEEAELDGQNVHLQPVCHLLGVLPEDLNEALCSFTIQAGRDHSVKRSLNRAKAENGLEALLKATYGALFSYLVERINDSIAYKDHCESDVENEEPSKPVDPAQRPAASIGVLDIFGFESFKVNSFEQLCINYCNEALQQQFNAFVLKNEQAEYQREGIEWSFIEFPENQDVLDLIEKRGTGIFSILDDQCRAPGPSDKAFALDVYKLCKDQSRFEASRQQTAALQFAVLHYAGPVEYTTAGFTEKNRDELPKEASELLRNSEVPFVQEIAAIIQHSHELPAGAITGTPAKLHRADSSVGRATVGGQFRRQLRNLRNKIDLTKPHYVRCLKPNDMLVPYHFDQAIVAEQLRCGGILEAVRVARAGFTQHYPHADFVRRYRALAWKELTKKDVTQRQPSPTASRSSSRGTSFGGRSFGYVPPSIQSPKNGAKSPRAEMDPAEAKAVCKDLIKVLYRKIHQLARDDGEPIEMPESPSPVAKAKSYSTSSPAPSWSRGSSPSVKKTVSQSVASQLPPVPLTSGSVKSRYSPWEQQADTKKEVTSPPPAPINTSSTSSTWKRGGLTSSDYAKVGIQMGKTKVFLRHKAFEALERIRSKEQTKAATKLNSIFRRYLARMAYLPFRDAFRRELNSRRKMYDSEDYKETKEADYYDDHDYSVSSIRFPSRAFHRGGSFASEAMVDKWMMSQIRDAIHNPVPRHEWGKQAPSKDFKWCLREGIWVKNYY